MSETGRILAEPRGAERPQARHGAAPAPAEPATDRALWPTFMRRTLEEEALREAPRAATG